MAGLLGEVRSDAVPDIHALGYHRAMFQRAHLWDVDGRLDRLLSTRDIGPAGLAKAAACIKAAYEYAQRVRDLDYHIRASAIAEKDEYKARPSRLAMAMAMGSVLADQGRVEDAVNLNLYMVTDKDVDQAIRKMQKALETGDKE